MAKISLADVLELPVDERILLVEEIWDSIAAIPETVILSSEQREELDRRLASYQNSLEAGAAWQEVKQRIRNQA